MKIIIIVSRDVSYFVRSIKQKVRDIKKTRLKFRNYKHKIGKKKSLNQFIKKMLLTD